MINDINILADYLGPRDLPALTLAALEEKYGIPQADAFVLFGAVFCPAGISLPRLKRLRLPKNTSSSVGMATRLMACGPRQKLSFRIWKLILCQKRRFLPPICKESTRLLPIYLNASRPTLATTSLTC